MKSGTSMATPVVAGAGAMLLSKYPDMTNVEIKLKLRESCQRAGSQAGWGLLDVGTFVGVGDFLKRPRPQLEKLSRKNT